FLATGSFAGETTFDPGGAGETVVEDRGSTDDVFLARYATDGRVSWVTRAGGSGTLDAVTGNALGAMPDGSSLVGGRFEGVATFGGGEENETTLTANGAGDIFLARFEANGTLGFARRAGGAGEDAVRGVSFLPDASFHAAGTFEGTATFAPGQGDRVLVSSGPRDAFVERAGPDGGL
ncbi:MAG: hypothetical protein ACC662_06080, partial [Planctomycetota bacterium]